MSYLCGQMFQNMKANTLTKQLDEAINTFALDVERKQNLKTNIVNLTYQKFFSLKYLIVLAIRDGIPFNLFNMIKQVTPFTDDDWTAFLGLSAKSLQRYKLQRDFRFKPIHTEKIIEVAEVTNFGISVFDTLDKFKLWLNTPNFALGSSKPIEMIKNSYGKELVMAELTRIDHGIFV